MNKGMPVFLVIICTLCAFFLFFNNKHVIQKSDDCCLEVGTNAEYPPFSFIKNDIIVGFDIDIITEVAQRLGKKLKLYDMSFDLLLPKLQLGHIQCIAAGISITEARSKNVLFTTPYFENDPLLIISLALNGPINTIQDLFGKTVVVNEGYTADAFISAISEISIKRLATPMEAFLFLKTKLALAFVAAKSSVEPFFMHHGKNEFNIKVIEGASDSYALAISKNHSHLLVPIEKALNGMRHDGTLDYLKKKWSIQ